MPRARALWYWEDRIQEKMFWELYGVVWCALGFDLDVTGKPVPLRRCGVT